MAAATASPVSEAAWEPTWRPPAWPLAERIAFRFCCVYLLLYGLGETGLINFIPRLSPSYQHAWRLFVPWVAIHVFGLSGPVTVYPAVNGSGDSTLDYV